eukprot:g2749.t1
MEYEENTSTAPFSTPPTPRRRPSLKKLTALGKSFRKHLPITPKSERALGSQSGSESNSVLERKPSGLTSRLKKRLSRSEAIPRRSFSSTDLDKLDNSAKETIETLMKKDEVIPITITDSSKTTVHQMQTDAHQSVIQWETPVSPKSELIQEMVNIDTRSSSFVSLPSTPEDTLESDKELQKNNPPVKTPPTEQKEAVLGLDELDTAKDIGDDKETTDAVVCVEVEIDDGKIGASLDETKLIEKKIEGELEVAREVISKPQEMEVISMTKQSETEVKMEAKDEQMMKRKKTGITRFLLRQAPLSIATLTVGVLMIFLKKRSPRLTRPAVKKEESLIKSEDNLKTYTDS